MDFNMDFKYLLIDIRLIVKAVSMDFNILMMLYV